MAFYQNRTEQTEWQRCMRCGRRIKLLDNPRSLAIFLGQASVQRRGFQCLNCGQMTCFECSDNRFRCACGSNAWIALPYLEKSTENGYAPRSSQGRA